MMDKDEQRKKDEYKEIYERHSPNSAMLRPILRAFYVGGLICVLGQCLIDTGKYALMLDEKASGAFASIVLVFLGALFTGLGVYDVLGQYAGAGSVVPITGFANSVVAPAMEFKREGYVMGVGAKMFSIAGPVILYGTLFSALIGLVYLVFNI